MFRVLSKYLSLQYDIFSAMNQSLADTAALLSDPGRAAIAMALIGGVALPAGQLAMIANVTPQTASSHLARLVDGRLFTVEQQGRHRYYRIANAEVAHAIEALLAITPHPKHVVERVTRDEQTNGLSYARSCYSHLAGEIAVKIVRKLQDLRVLVAQEPRGYRVTRTGRLWFAQLAIDVSQRQSSDPKFARRCLDWTERRHHLAGPLGSALFGRFRELKWVAPVRHSRAVRVTVEGQFKLQRLFGSDLGGKC
jgi:DNA-binding transcriptional ArsR family regulator